MSLLNFSGTGDGGTYLFVVMISLEGSLEIVERRLVKPTRELYRWYSLPTLTLLMVRLG